MTSLTCADAILLKIFGKRYRRNLSTVVRDSTMADEYNILGEDVKSFVRQRSLSGNRAPKLSKGTPETPRKKVPLALTLSQWDSIDKTCRPVQGKISVRDLSDTKLSITNPTL
jgi:hypothetical protein